MTTSVPMPVKMMQLSIQASLSMAEAQMLMTLRMLRLFGLWPAARVALPQASTGDTPPPLSRTPAAPSRRPARRGPAKP
mgnify:CR=1 FL=1